nr:MAG TPA: PGDYG protein [Caudoviricetes sp.]
MKYRKKPVVIEAFQLGIDNIPDWFMNAVTKKDAILHGTSTGFYHANDTNADIKTLEGWLHADYGDYIIQGIKNEIYPCKPDIFEKTYEPIN